MYNFGCPISKRRSEELQKVEPERMNKSNQTDHRVGKTPNEGGTVAFMSGLWTLQNKTNYWQEHRKSKPFPMFL